MVCLKLFSYNFFVILNVVKNLGNTHLMYTRFFASLCYALNDILFYNFSFKNCPVYDSAH